MNKKKLLVIHPTIAPYRIDFFNILFDSYNTRICLQYENLLSQKFDYTKISSQFHFSPIYLPESSTTALCKAIWKQITDFKPDYILTCEFGPTSLTCLIAKWLKRSHMKIIVMTDDSLDMLAGRNDFSARHRIARKLLTPIVDEVIVTSKEVEKWYNLTYQKGIWMPIIVDDKKAAARYERLLPKSKEIAEKYNLMGQKVVLSVCRLVNLKNLHRVIDSFSKCKTAATLVIVGDGPERSSLQEHAAKFGKDIILTGRFEGDDLYAWYNLTSVFILASFKEAFGAVTNEALLAGCRVVISNKAGSSCLVTDDNGELVNPYDEGEISNAINRQLSLVEIPELTTARRSLMPITFEERINVLLKKLNTL